LKNIEAVIASEKVGVGGFTVLDAKGRGKGKRSQLAGSRGTGNYTAEFNTKNYVFTVVDDSLVDKVISAIIDAAGTGSAGDGKIFITTIDDAIDIGSKQRAYTQFSVKGELN